MSLVDQPTDKKCYRCKKVKNKNKFKKDPRYKDSCHSWCLDCWSKFYKEHNRKNPGRSTKNMRIRKFGITPEKIKELLENQNNRCAICGMENPNCLDHDHKTMKARGMLCNGCNAGIGFMRESISVLRNAIQYLEDHSNGNGN